MKYRFILISIGILFLSACSGSQDKSSTTVDSTKTDSAIGKIDEVNAPNEVTNPEVQEYLRTFIREFESVKGTLPFVSYEDSYEYGADKHTYYFQEGNLLYIVIENVAEGGFMQTFVIKKENSGDVVFKTSTDGGNTFTCSYLGNRSGFLVTSGNEPLITGVTEPYQDNYSEAMRQQFGTVEKDKEKFNLKEGFYEYYADRKMVDSDYGKVEVYKLYKINEKLFGLDLKETTVKLLPDSDLTKKIIGKWTPLHTLHGGYERQVVCGHEPSLVIKEEEGKIKWQELGLQDYWEGVVTGIRKTESNTYEAELSNQGNNSKRVLKEEMGKRILFINERPYTDDPDIFPVAEFDEDCEGFH